MMQYKIELKIGILRTLIHLMNENLLSINQPKINRPVELLIYSTGLKLFSKLRTKEIQWTDKAKTKGNWTPLNTEAAFLKIFLQNLEPVRLQDYELATREHLLKFLK